MLDEIQALGELASGDSTKETLTQLGKIKGFKPTISRIRAALDKLKRAGVVTKLGGSYCIEDRLLRSTSPR